MSALSREIAPAIAPSQRSEDKSGSEGAGRRRIREVDGYRALAALMIIIFHAWTVGYQPFRDTAFETIVRGSDSGVSLFFALSGMVMFLPMVRGALKGDVPSGRKSLARRLYRILPLYFLLVILVWSARFAGTPRDFWDLLHHLTFTQVYDKQHIFWLLGPAWSLADEMHYYVLICLLGPPLARLAARRDSANARLALLATLPLLMLSASLAYTTIVAYGLHIPAGDSWVYYNPLARADSFAEGMLLAVALSIPGAMAVRRRTALALSATGLVMMAALWVARDHVPAVAVYYFAIAGFASLLLLGGAAMLHERQPLSRFLRWGPFQLLAKIGFSLYLLHEPVMIQLGRWHVLYFLDPVAWPLSTVALIAVSTIAAWLSYSLVEKPGVRLQKLFADLRARQVREPARRAGPPPRWLPDLTLRTADGAPVALRELPRDRPVLLALDRDGASGLAEQRFRLDAGEADGFFVTSTASGRGPAGTTVLVDMDERLSAALNGNTGLIEVSPGGLITAMLEPEPATVAAVAR